MPVKEKETPTLNVKVTEEDTNALAADVYQHSDKEKQVVEDVFSRFRVAQTERDANYEYLDARTPIQYIDDSVRRFVTKIDERDDLEDWQARVHDPFTENKSLAILGKVVEALPIAQLIGRGDEDPRRANILDNLYTYSEDVDDYDEFMVFGLLEAITKGTFVGYEGYEEKIVNRRNITSYNSGDEVKISERKEVVDKLFGAIVPIEEFYPQSMGIRRIKDMSYCFRRKIMPFQKFRTDFAMFKKAKFVRESHQRTGGENDSQLPFYMDYVTTTVKEGNVEVIWYYNTDTDEYVITANGIWLNPLAGEEVSPLPWNHKQLPFYEIRYSAFGSDFFLGESFPNRIKPMQDVLNVLHNMLLDQAFLTIFPPILTLGTDSIEDDFLRPGRRTQVDTGGIPLNQAYQKLDLGTPGGFHQFILDYTKKVLEESSIDSVQQGVAGGKSRVTATEIREAAEGVISLLGLFARFVRYGMKRKAILRAGNIMQFWMDKRPVRIEQILGEESAKRVAEDFRTFRIDNTVLSSGKRGSKIIDIFFDRNKMPTKMDQRVKAAILERKTGRKIELVAVDPEYQRNILFDVEFVPNPKSEKSKSIDLALEVNFQRTMNELYPDLIKRTELAAELVEKFKRDPVKVLKEDAVEAELAPPQQQGTGAGRPRGAVEALPQNLQQGAAGGDEGSLAVRNLMMGA